MIYTDKTKCCGCEACAFICPTRIIRMYTDNEGFSYPTLIDENKCIKCNKCIEVCPVKNASAIHSEFKKAYAGWAINDSDTILSSSGGFAAVLSKAFIKKDGVVYGAVYSNDYKNVVYKRVDIIQQVDLLRGSKYSQALKDDIYRLVKADLLNNRRVLFIGTPCDSYAVKRLFSKFANLYVVSIICHGPTSLTVHKAFCEDLETKYGSCLSSFTLRYKKDGEWKPYYIRALFKNGAEHLEKFEGSNYDTAFQYFKRPSCSDCQFKNNHFAADLLIGDNHSAKSGDDDYNIHGVSSVLLLSEKGNELLDIVRNEEFFMLNANIERHITQRAVHSSVKRNNDRNMFVSLLNEFGLQKACNEESIIRNKKLNKRTTRKKKFVSKTKSVIKKILRF